MNFPRDFAVIHGTSGLMSTLYLITIFNGPYLFVSLSLAVSLLQEEWCWKEKSIEIEVTDKDLSDVSFVQSGYILSCSLSHDIILVGHMMFIPRIC